MKKLLALLICISLLVGYCFTLTACKSDKADNPPIEDGKNDGVTPPDDVTPPDEPDGPTILVPEYKDYGRGTVNFTDIKYSTPDVAAIISGFDTITALIKANEIPVEEMIAMIVEMEDDYTNYLTMTLHVIRSMITIKAAETDLTIHPAALNAFVLPFTRNPVLMSVATINATAHMMSSRTNTPTYPLLSTTVLILWIMTTDR